MDQPERPNPQMAEPSYQGRPLSYWIGQLQIDTKDDYQWPRRRAVVALVAIGSPAVPALVESFQDKNPFVRLGVLGALGQIKPHTTESIKALINALDDGDENVRAVGALFVSEIGPAAKDAVSRLVRVMQTDKPFGNYRAARALGKIGPDAKAAIPALAAMLSNPDQAMIAEAAGALCKIDPQDQRPLPVLIALVKEGRDATARATSAGVLGTLGAVAAPAIPVLKDALHDAATNVRVVAAIAYQKIDKRSDSAIKALIGMMMEKDQFLAGCAVDAIAEAKLDTPEALRALKDALPANNALSVHAAEALWKLKPKNEATFPALLKALDSSDLIARLSGMEVLGRMGKEAKGAVPALRKALNDGSEIVREAAREALEKIESQAAAKAGVP
jgi:HEAT repeat protein